MRLGIKGFLLDEKSIQRDSYIWNISGSMLMAFQSVIMLMVLTRTLGIIEAGIFTIAYANANLFLTIGKFGMRNFQVSDIKNQFGFTEYFASRLITTAAMILFSFIYLICVANKYHYSTEKSYVIIWMCLFKAIDSIEDIFHGLYQKRGRLDVAAKAMTIRMFITILAFGISVVVTGNLLAGLIISTIITAILFGYFTILTYKELKEDKKGINKRKISQLLFYCLPLAIGAFLSFYIGNAPKYAIDACLSDELQACYGFIAMPVFVIGLLNNFIFNPMLYKMSRLWNEGKIKEFVIRIFRQVIIIFLITLTCIIGAYLIGIPVLSWLYNTDLSKYKIELIILLLGGGFLGLSGFLNTIITIIRFQKVIVWGYGIIAILAYVLSPLSVEKAQIMGAAVSYTLLMGILCIIFIMMLIYGLIKKRNEVKI